MQTVPSEVLHYMHSGVPLQHKPFWKSLTVNDLFSLYNLASVSPSQIVCAIKAPDDMTPLQSRAFNFFIGNLKDCNKMRRFLRFVTGSPGNTGKDITVCFNSTEGLARRPIAHTCSCEIEIPLSFGSMDAI